MNYRITFICPACGVIEYSEVDMSGGIGKSSCKACGCDIVIREKNLKPMINILVIEAVPPEDCYE